jgi:Group II intron, maturase-specific domain
MGSKARTASGAGHKIQALCFHALWSRGGNPYSLQLILVVPPARELSDIARKLNPLLQGWLNFYGRAIGDISNGESINATLVAWAMREYKRYAGQKIRAGRMIGSMAITGRGCSRRAALIRYAVQPRDSQAGVMW